MIIKRNLKTQMPSLKRRRPSGSVGEEDESYGARKKKKPNGYYPLNLLNEVAAGIIPISLQSILDSQKELATPWSTKISWSPADLDLKSEKGTDSATRTRPNPTPEIPRPPLVRTSRGRVQVLPSRFNDSVIENWRKDSKTSLRDSTLEDDTQCKKDKFSFRPPKLCNQNGKKVQENERIDYRFSKYSALCEEEEEDDDEREKVRCVGFKNFSFKKYSSSCSALTSMHEQQIALEFDDQVDVMGGGRIWKDNGEKRNGFYGPEDFYSGDIVWAKAGKKEPFWPAIVINPMSQAPELVLRACIADAACVMFFGYSESQTHRDYAWIRRGMIFPFMDYIDRFQGQSKMDESRACEFHMAIEEAFLAERGFTEKLIADINLAAGNTSYDESILRGIQEATGSNQDQECSYRYQDWFGKKKDTWTCEGCGASLPFTTKKMKASNPGVQSLCKTCARLTKSKHYCGICKKIWSQSDSGSWVRCDGCKVWVHAECDKISSNHFKNLGGTDYYCPTCKAKFDFELSDSEKGKPKVKWNNNKNPMFVLPNKVAVLSNDVEGIYFPSLHLVVCKCGYCGTQKQALSEWEQHTGSKSRNWRASVRVKSSMLPLEQWMLQLAEYRANVASVKPPKRSSMKEQKHKLLAFLQEKYEPVYAKWTTERCAVCRWVEDWDYNKIIICNRCQIAVHQECYGARNVQDFTSWLCKTCETPDLKRECCLCPVKGGALKPTDVDTLWVHVTCAWFRPEVCFASDEKMEPAIGILSIPSNSFVKVEYIP